MRAGPIPPPRAQRGCLGGCFTGLLRLVLILVLGAVGLIAFEAIFVPWAFFLGGRFHYVPQWQGWGRAHTSSGDYVLLVQMYPSNRRQPMSPTMANPHVTGYGWLCTPQGEKIRMRVYGMFADRSIGIHPDGHRMSLSMSRLVNIQTGPDDYSPHLDFQGTWTGDSLIGDDHGSFAKAIAPDGHLYKYAEHRLLQQTAPLTLKEDDFIGWGRPPAFDAACAALKR
jgi:hypothetical protein